MKKIYSKLLNCTIALLEGDKEKCPAGCVPYTFEEIDKLNGKTKEELIEYHNKKFDDRIKKIMELFDGEDITDKIQNGESITTKEGPKTEKEKKNESLFK